MNELFPYSNILAAILVFIVGFGIHWLNYLARILHWELMPRHGFGINIVSNPKGYDRIITVSDMAIGWLYGFIGIGLLLGTEWGSTLLWIPGIILSLEGIGYWIITAKKDIRTERDSYFTRSEWSTLNLLSGLFLIVVAWHAL